MVSYQRYWLEWLHTPSHDTKQLGWFVNTKVCYLGWQCPSPEAFCQATCVQSHQRMVRHLDVKTWAPFQRFRQDLVESRSRNICCLNHCIALESKKVSGAVVTKRLSYQKPVKVPGTFQYLISRLWDLARPYDKTSYQILKRPSGNKLISVWNDQRQSVFSIVYLLSKWDVVLKWIWKGLRLLFSLFNATQKATICSRTPESQMRVGRMAISLMLS